MLTRLRVERRFRQAGIGVVFAEFGRIRQEDQPDSFRVARRIEAAGAADADA